MADPFAAESIPILLVSTRRDSRDEIAQALEVGGDHAHLFWVSQPDLAAMRARELAARIVLVDDELGGASQASLVQDLSSRLPDAAILALVDSQAIGHAQEALLAGARAFITRPLIADDLISAVRQVTARPASSAAHPQADRLGRLVVFCAPKGGTGRTTAAVNTAISLCQLEALPLALVDADYAAPAVDVQLDLRDRLSVIDLLPKIAALDQQLIDSVLVEHSTGLRVLLAPPPADITVHISLPQLEQILVWLKRMFPWVVVDLGLPIDQLALGFLDAADLVIMSANPEMIGLRNAQLMIAQFRSRGYPEDKVWLLLNRAGYHGGLQEQDVAEHLGLTVRYRIPNSQVEATERVNRGVPFVLSSPRSAVSRAYQGLARELVRCLPLPSWSTAAPEYPAAAQAAPVAEPLGTAPIPARSDGPGPVEGEPGALISREAASTPEAPVESATPRVAEPSLAEVVLEPTEPAPEPAMEQGASVEFAPVLQALVEPAAAILPEPVVEEAASQASESVLEPVVERAAPILAEPLVVEPTLQASELVLQPVLEPVAPILPEPVVTQAGPQASEPVVEPVLQTAALELPQERLVEPAVATGPERGLVEAAPAPALPTTAAILSDPPYARVVEAVVSQVAPAAPEAAPAPPAPKPGPLVQQAVATPAQAAHGKAAPGGHFPREVPTAGAGAARGAGMVSPGGRVAVPGKLGAGGARSRGPRAIGQWAGLVLAVIVLGASLVVFGLAVSRLRATWRQVSQPAEPVSLSPTPGPPAGVAAGGTPMPALAASASITATLGLAEASAPATALATETASLTPAPTLTDTPAPTLTHTPAPSPTDTPAPSETPTRAPTATATLTPTSQLSPTVARPTATRTRRPTARPTISPSPTATRVPKVSAPLLLAPESNATQGGVVSFQWQPTAPLPAGTGYEVVWWNDGEDPLSARGIAPPVTTFSLDANLDVLYNAGQFKSSDIFWTVLVVTTNPYVRLTQPDASVASKLVYRAGGHQSEAPPKK